MFAVLVLVAIFSSALPFEAAAQQNPPKCNDDTILKIYNYWRNNGGVPRRVIEHVSIYCQPSEASLLLIVSKKISHQIFLNPSRLPNEHHFR